MHLFDKSSLEHKCASWSNNQDLCRSTEEVKWWWMKRRVQEGGMKKRTLDGRQRGMDWLRGWKGFFWAGGSEAVNLSIRFEDRNKDVPVHDIVDLLKFVILTILVKSTLARNYSVLLEGWSLSTDLVPILPSAKVIRWFTECPPKTGKLTRNLE
jgi:hypothetical protein